MPSALSKHMFQQQQVINPVAKKDHLTCAQPPMSASNIENDSFGHSLPSCGDGSSHRGRKLFKYSIDRSIITTLSRHRSCHLRLSSSLAYYFFEESTCARGVLIFFPGRVGNILFKQKLQSCPWPKLRPLRNMTLARAFLRDK